MTISVINKFIFLFYSPYLDSEDGTEEEKEDGVETMKERAVVDKTRKKAGERESETEFKKIQQYNS